MKNKPILIGIAGGSASGKSSISKQLKEAFEYTKSVVIIRQDDYYKDQSEKTMEERVKTNYDHPFAFDNDLLVLHIQELLQRHAILKPTYDFVHHTRSELVENVQPCDVVVLEGLFVLEDEERFIRRLVRDVKKRGRTLESVVEQYTTTVRDMHNLFVEPSKRYADLIIPEGGHNVVAIDLLITKISSIIDKRA